MCSVDAKRRVEDQREGEPGAASVLALDNEPLVSAEAPEKPRIVVLRKIPQINPVAQGQLERSVKLKWVPEEINLMAMGVSKLELKRESGVGQQGPK